MFEFIRVVKCKKCNRMWRSEFSYIKSKYGDKCWICGGDLEEVWISEKEYKKFKNKKLLFR